MNIFPYWWRLFAVLIFTSIAGAADVAGLRLVPFPKSVELTGGECDLSGPLTVELSAGESALLVGQLSAELGAAGLSAPAVQLGKPGGHRLRLGARLSEAGEAVQFREGATEEDYVLRAGAGGIEITAPGSSGLFYGVQTLRQLIRANREGTRLPGVTIRDWPSLRWRAFQDDLTRGPSSKFAELRREAELGAFFKHNIFTYYMEHQYAFSKHPVIGPREGSLTPAELKMLVQCGAPMHLQILGNQQSFGHFTAILAHPQYAELRETSFLLCPTNERTYQLLDDLYSEVLPLLPFQFFNVCCDETVELGTGPSKPVAEQIGVGGLYVRHIRRVHDLVTGKYGKRMMMWGDIILNHPKHLTEVPKDTVMLTWGYDPRQSFEDQIVPFAKSGYEFFVCPGVNNWSRVLPDFQATTVNIRNFVRDGIKHGAAGMLITSWDDDGENFNAPNWHGFAWGAECAWTGSATSPEDFNRRLGGVLFGEEGEHFGRAIALLARPGLGGLFNSRFWDTGKPLAAGAEGGKALADTTAALASTRQAIQHLEACQKEGVANADLLDYWIFGARRLELFSARDLRRAEAGGRYAEAQRGPAGERGEGLSKAQALIQQNRNDYASLSNDFARLWHRENKPYALEWTLKRYANEIARQDAILQRLSAARDQAAAGVALPPVKEFAPELGAP